MKTNGLNLFQITFIERLYPTFKEWKLLIQKFNQKRSIGLYPTFKEWKL